MTSKNKGDPLSVETREYRIFNPSDVKQSVEIAVKPKLSLKELVVVEKKGKIVKKSKSKKKVVKNKKDEKVKLKKDGYVLIITEKPQAAGKIASALSGGSDRKVSKLGGVSYYEFERNGKRIVVACAVGHLFSVSQKVKGSYYPIFDIDWFPNFEVRKKDFTKKYYTLIKSLVKGAGEFVVATDFDTEGEVIGYNVVRFIGGQDDAKRMKFSSLTVGEIENSYKNMFPTIEWGQAIAGETRHFLDWMYGINLSRALMSAVKKTGRFRVMSIGRVQGPALNLIVQKEKLIRNFKPTPYWQIFLIVSDGKNKLEVKYYKDVTKKEELDRFRVLKGMKGDAKTRKTKQVIKPPAPFDLTSLQTEAYKFYSITPSQTLQIAQKLYLAGVISYPRTSSQKIPESMKPLGILKKLGKRYSDLVEYAKNLKPVEGNKSDPAHPAIIPTGVFQKLDGQDEKIYELIVKRFISCFCENAELENKRVEVKVESLKFVTKGMEILKKGWMNVYPAKMDEKEIADMNGEVDVESVRIDEKMTKPPKRYSPASIVTELEKRGLGTKATRANILETLYNRNYIKDKQIRATELGIRLIESMEKNSPVIIDEKLTRDIEKDMDNIRSSKKDLIGKEKKVIEKAREALTKISEDFKKQELKIGQELVQANEALWEQEKKENELGVKCPSCGKGVLGIKFSPRFKSNFIGCSEYPNCKQTYSLPKGNVKKQDKKCEYCEWPMFIRVMFGRKPWIFCANPNCESRKELDIDGKTKVKS